MCSRYAGLAPPFVSFLMTPIRILVADGSAVARREISQMLSSDSELEVVAIAPTGHIALEKAEQLRPEVMVLELTLPDMKGMDVLKAVRLQFPRLPVLIFSALAESTGNITMDALAHGASDYITKPTAAGGVPYLEQAREPLIAKIKELHARIQPEPPKASRCASGTSWRRDRPGSPASAWW